MNKVVFGLVLLASVATAQLPILAQGGDGPVEQGSLDISVSPGPAPVKVTITGPASFLTIANSYRGGRHMGMPYVINWGDGKTDPDWGKKFSGSHSYNVPGQYVIRASLLRWHPDDRSSPSWTATRQIQVTGNENKKPSLQIRNFKGGEFAQDYYPSFSLAVQTNTRCELLAELIDEDKKVIGESVSRPFSYSDPSFEYNFSPHDCGTVYDALKKRGNRNCYLRLHLKDTKGNILATAQTPTFTITPIVPREIMHLHDATVEQLESGSTVYPVSSGRGGTVISAVQKSKNPLEVILRYKTNFKYGFSYSLDWGDGTKPQTVIAPKSQKAGLMEDHTLYFKHVYPKSGKYFVKLKSTESDPNSTLDKMYSYERLEVNPG